MDPMTPQQLEELRRLKSARDVLRRFGPESWHQILHQVEGTGGACLVEAIERLALELFPECADRIRTTAMVLVALGYLIRLNETRRAPENRGLTGTPQKQGATQWRS
jgi:hypothetical protein